MTKVVKITKIKGVATFVDFTWESSLNEFLRYNLIYGLNGSGKTTISRIFRCLEMGVPLESGNATLDLNTGEVHHTNFAHLVGRNVRVFNDDFVKKNVFPTEGLLPPVFVEGQENVQNQDQLDKSRFKFEALGQELPKLRGDIATLEREFSSYCSSIASEIRQSLEKSGIDYYRNYDRTKFIKIIDKVIGIGVETINRLTDKERKVFESVIEQKPMSSISQVAFTPITPSLFITEIRQTLEESIVATAIDMLSEDRDLAVWVENGLKLHLRNHSEHCLFCDNPLSSARLAALESQFNTSYEDLKSRILILLDKVNASRNSIKLTLPSALEFYPHLREEFLLASEALNAEIAVIDKGYQFLIDTLENKLRSMFLPIGLDSEEFTSETPKIDSIKKLIDAHNSEAENLKELKADAAVKLEQDYVLDKVPIYVEKSKLIKSKKDIIESVQSEKDSVQERIGELEQSLREHRRPAGELNADLASYLGHEELTFEVFETGYRITRGGKPARSLSEGERTAIALLYFLKTLRDLSFDREHGLVVLDDPISSLDDGALFSAFSFIKAQLESCGQLILLTHNFSFFRQAKRWMLEHNKKKNNQQSRFYMLESVSVAGARKSVIRPLDKLLADYESDYQFLFSRVYSIAKNTQILNLEENYHIPNMARRLLEAFVSFRYPGPGSLEKKLNKTGFDAQKLVHILRFCHSFSHADHIPQGDHDAINLMGTKKTMELVLEFIEFTDPAHFSEIEQSLVVEEGD